MKRGPVLFAVLAVLAAPGAACARRGPRAASRASVVALVGDQPVEYASFATYVKAATGDEPRNISPQVASSLLDQYLDELLLDRAVEDAGPARKDQTLESRRRELISRRARLETMSDAELRAEYDAHPERFRHSAVVRVSQLLLPTKKKADEAIRKLDAGADWNEVSRELSVAPNAAQGGALGLLSQSDLPHEFERVIWALRPGAVSQVLPTSHGFHVFRIEERLEEKTIPFEEAAPGLRLALAEERSSAAAEALVAEARRKHPVSVVEEHLPFPYVGTTARFVAGGS